MISIRKQIDQSEKLLLQFRALRKAYVELTRALPKAALPVNPELSGQCKDECDKFTALLDDAPAAQTIDQAGKIALSPARYDTNPKILAFFDEVLRRADALPGVRGAALALALPQSVAIRTNVQVGEQPEGDVSKWPMCQIQSVTPGYFHLLGIPVRQGREFDERDN